MNKKEPMRMCVSCREKKPQKELLRVVAVDGKIMIAKPKCEGRGAYICKNMECFAKCKKTRALQRALSAELPDDVICEIEAIINGK